MIIDFGKVQNKTILSTAGEFINPALEIVFESCQAETSRQYNIGLASCEFYRGKKRVSHETALCLFKAYEISTRP